MTRRLLVSDDPVLTSAFMRTNTSSVGASSCSCPARMPGRIAFEDAAQGGNSQRGSLFALRGDRLPKLNPVSRWVDQPTKLAKVIALTLWVNRHTIRLQTIQQTI